MEELDLNNKEPQKSKLQEMNDQKGNYFHKTQSFQTFKFTTLNFPNNILSEKFIENDLIYSLKKIFENHYEIEKEESKKFKYSLQFMKINKISSEDVIEWVRSTNQHQRYDLFLNKDEIFAMNIIKMSWEYNQNQKQVFQVKKNFNSEKRKLRGILFEDLEKQFEIKQIQKINQQKINSYKVVESNIKIISQDELFDTICFNQKFLSDINQLLQHMQVISGDQMFQSHPNIIMNKKEQQWTLYFPNWFDPFQFEHLSTWIVAYLERQIWLKYFRYLKEKSQMSQYQNSQLIYQGYLKNFWANLDFNQKYDIINNLRDQFIQETFLNEQNVNRQDKLFTFFQIFKKYLQMETFEDIQQHYDKFVKQQNQDEFINMMFYTELKQFNSIKIIINRLIYKKLILQYENNLPEMLEEIEKNGNKKKQKKKKPKKLSNKSKNNQSETGNSYVKQSSLYCISQRNKQQTNQNNFTTNQSESDTNSFYMKQSCDLNQNYNNKGRKLKNKQEKEVLSDNEENNPNFDKKLKIQDDNKSLQIQSADVDSHINLKGISNDLVIDHSNTQDQGEFITVKSKKDQKLSDSQKNSSKQNNSFQQEQRIRKRKSNVTNIDSPSINDYQLQTKSEQKIEKTKIRLMTNEQSIQMRNDIEQKINIQKNPELKSEQSIITSETDKLNAWFDNVDLIRGRQHHCLVTEVKKKSLDNKDSQKTKSRQKSRKIFLPSNYSDQQNRKTSLITQKDKFINQVIIEGFENKKENDNIIFDLNKVIKKEQKQVKEEKEGNSLQKCVEKIYKMKFNEDIDNYLQHNQELNNKLKPLRIITFQRISQIVSKMFTSNDRSIKVDYRVESKLFGSQATGLSLPDSDIDVCLSGFNICDQSDIIGILKKLNDFMEHSSWVVELKCIFNCPMPILKMKINPLVSFKQFVNIEEYQELYQQVLESSPENLDLDIELDESFKEYVPINVDITVENQMPVLNMFEFNFQNQNKKIIKHNGLISTEMMNQWLSFYPSLFKVALVVKQFLHERGLNNSYSGGLSSYCMLIIIISVLKSLDNGLNEDVPNILLSFFDFYANKFNYHSTGISVFLEPSSFFPLHHQSSCLTVVDPLNFNNNLTSNCFQIENIIDHFRKAHRHLVQFKQSIMNAIMTKKIDYARLSKMSLNELKNHNQLSATLKDNLIFTLINN